MTQVDKLFRQNQVGFGGFEFNRDVAKVFDDMISRSVPLYDDVQRAIARLAGLLDHDCIDVVDLGCSTGTSLIHLAKALPDRSLRLTGVDSSSAMLEQCEAKLKKFQVNESVRLFESDLCDFQFKDASIVLLNYTLQFVDVDRRLELMKRLCQSIRPGGFLVLSEKFSHSDPAIHAQWIELYCDYKRVNGYSELEISRKRDALENVLVPFTVAENEQLLKDAGFSKTELLLKWFNFGTLLAHP